MALLLLVGVGLLVGLGVGLRLGLFGGQVRVEVVPPPVCVTLLLERVLCELYHRLNVPELVCVHIVGLVPLPVSLVL